MDDYYSRLMENNSVKIISISCSIGAILIGTPLACGMILFEKLGSDKKRTIINQLVSVSCWSYIFHCCVIIQSLEVFRFFYGPLPQAWCFAHSILRNSSLTIFQFYYNAMSTMRQV